MIQISQEGNNVILRRWRSSTTMLAYNILFFSIAALQYYRISLCYGFSSTDITSNKRQSSTFFPLYSEVQTPSYTLGIGFSDDEDVDNLPNLSGSLEKCILQQFTLNEHKPLGCSVEESLAVETDENAKYVFVSEVKKGGNAAKAGLKEGDVIVQLSGTFDELIDVAGLGIDRIQSLVGGRQEDSPIIIRVARGSDVKERHELALVELCIVGDDAMTADCITAIYSDEAIDMRNTEIPQQCGDEDDETECMLDSLWDTWSDGLTTTGSEEEEVQEDKPKKKKAQPWASRSSGSGTYVRDPKTGKMVNIDE